MDIVGAVQELTVVDWLVTVIFIVFLYKVVIEPRLKRRNEPPPEPELPPMKKQGTFPT